MPAAGTMRTLARRLKAGRVDRLRVRYARRANAAGWMLPLVTWRATWGNETGCCRRPSTWWGIGADGTDARRVAIRCDPLESLTERSRPP